MSGILTRGPPASPMNTTTVFYRCLYRKGLSGIVDNTAVFILCFSVLFLRILFHNALAFRWFGDCTSWVVSQHESFLLQNHFIFVFGHSVFIYCTQHSAKANAGPPSAHGYSIRSSHLFKMVRGHRPIVRKGDINQLCNLNYNSA